MIGTGGNGIFKILAAVDLSCAQADQAVENALTVAQCLRGEVTLLSVIDRRRFERGVRQPWTPSAFGNAFPDLDIHRLVIPGDPAPAASAYADQIGADLVVVPAQYRVRRWLREIPLASLIAPLTSRCVWTTPAGKAELAGALDSLRVACIMRLDGADERLCAVAQAVLQKRDGELLLVHLADSSSGPFRRENEEVNRNRALQAMRQTTNSLTVAWRPVIVESSGDDALLGAAREHGFGLIVAGRSMYVGSTESSKDMLPLANRLPCSLLSVPFSSAVSGTSFPPSI